MIGNVRRVLALGSIVVVLTSTLGTTPASAQPKPPTPIPPGEYFYSSWGCYTLTSAVHSEGGCYYDIPSKLVVHPPTGSTQTSTERNDCRDYVREETVDYQPDGIHLVRNYRDGGGRYGTNDPDCGPGLGGPHLCNPIPAPLILPTGAKPGQHWSYTMVCAPFQAHQVSIDIVGTKRVMIDGEWLTTLIIRTRDVVATERGTMVVTKEAWVIPRNGLVVFSRSRVFSDNWFVIMTQEIKGESVLSTCSTCP